jgi:hypothetical protein
MAFMNSASTLMIDLFPEQSSSVTACVSVYIFDRHPLQLLTCQQNNLVRCTLAAVVVSVMQPLINRIGLGWTYVILGFLSLLTIPLIFLDIHVGPRYRLARQKRIDDSEGDANQDTGGAEAK